LQLLATDDVITFHLSQTGFATYLVEDNNAHTRKVTPNATPYCSDLPINAIPELDKADNCPALIEQKKKCQSIFSLIG
jgi:hypothetical protein